MTGARIAGFAFLVLGTTLPAQSLSRFPFKLRVVDPTGAVIPNAQVQARSATTDSVLLETKTDANGEANLTLESGAYSIRVSMPGFNNWRLALELPSQDPLVFTAMMMISAIEDPVVVTQLPLGFEVEHQTPDSAIPLEPVACFDPLPDNKLRHRRWTHFRSQ